MAVNSKQWATNYTVREIKSCTHCKLKTVSFRPHYLHREFAQITVIFVYVSGPDVSLDAECIADSYKRTVTQTGELPVFLMYDF